MLYRPERPGRSSDGGVESPAPDTAVAVRVGIEIQALAVRRPVRLVGPTRAGIHLPPAAGPAIGRDRDAAFLAGSAGGEGDPLLIRGAFGLVQQQSLFGSHSGDAAPVETSMRWISRPVEIKTAFPSGSQALR